ncbi:MAG: SDR family NAD(P)-dependent oxidoreductase, partial [Gemmatimonadota bacterium]
MDLGLDGKRAIITGGSRGIGRATAEVLGAEGCAVAICARNEEGVEKALESLRARAVTAVGSAVDVADGPSLERWVADSAEALGGVDIVVANVSALGGGEGEQGWRDAFGVDLLHTVRTVEAALPHLKRSDAGSIVIVSSVAAREAGAFEGPYGVLKA